MKSTSRGSRLVRMAARSPALASTGPEVARKLTPSSRAMIWASVVLPRPGGPNSSTWSSASPRLRAASMKTERLPLAWAWPTNSLSVWGRSARSGASAGAGSPETRRVISTPAGWKRSPSQFLQGGLDQRRRLVRLAQPAGGVLDGAAGGGLGDLQAHQRGDGFASGGRAGRGGRVGLGVEGGDGAAGQRLALQLGDDAQR